MTKRKRRQPERNPEVLRKFRSQIDKIREVSPTYGPMDFTTGGSSQNHRPELRKKKGGKGALDMSFKANDIKNKQDIINIGKAVKAGGNRVGVAKDHLHIDDRDSAARVFTEKGGDVAISNEIKAAQVQAKVAEADRKMAQLSEGVVASQSTVGQELLNQEIAKSEFLNKYEKKIESDNIKDPQILTDKVLSNQKRREEGKKPSIKDSFMESLTFFLPNIVGMAVGGLIEGAEGAVAGEKKAGELAGAFREYKFKREEMDQKAIKASQQKVSKPKMDITPDFKDKETGKPLFTKEVDGIPKFIDDQGNVVSSDRVVSIKEEMAERRQSRVDERQEKGFSESQNKLIIKNKDVFVKDRAAPAIESMKQVRNLKDLMASKTNITGLVEFKMAKGIAQEVGNLTSDERAVAANIVGFKGDINDIQEYLTSSMGTMRKNEINRLVQFLEPRIKDKIITNAMKHSKSAARRLKVDPTDYVQELLDETGMAFPDYEMAVKKAEELSKRDKYKNIPKEKLVETTLKIIRKIKNKKGNR